jgi:hypothetical protein
MKIFNAITDELGMNRIKADEVTGPVCLNWLDHACLIAVHLPWLGATTHAHVRSAT